MRGNKEHRRLGFWPSMLFLIRNFEKSDNWVVELVRILFFELDTLFFI